MYIQNVCSQAMNNTFTVPVIRIADFINNVVATRSLPADQPGAVVMKLDVEVGDMISRYDSYI